METTQDTLTLCEARKQLSGAIEAVLEASVDHHDSENSAGAGTWAKSQTYAVLLHRLQTYTTAQRVYDAVLAERVRRS